MSREKPIIFSTEMVQKILSGEKNQTRRAVKIPSWTWDRYDDLSYERCGGLFALHRKNGCREPIIPPYMADDVLWVRETWSIGIQSGDVIYKADYASGKKSPLADGEAWKPSIHMPKDVARLYLEVVCVRVERVQDISEKDALAEGSHKAVWPVDAQEGEKMQQSPTHKNGFSWLWDNLNAERALGWEVNPWVWVLEIVIKTTDKEGSVSQTSALTTCQDIYNKNLKG